MSYVTSQSVWPDAETELAPTDYCLSGRIAITKIDWTVDLSTERGVLRGDAVFSSDSPAAPLKTCAGPITLLTQGFPAAGAVVPGRGWINAGTSTNGAADEGSLLADVELQITSGFAAKGELFGSMSVNVLDLAVCHH